MGNEFYEDRVEWGCAEWVLNQTSIELNGNELKRSRVKLGFKEG